MLKTALLQILQRKYVIIYCRRYIAADDYFRHARRRGAAREGIYAGLPL